MSLHIIILAAGLGKRMFSETPKVLHPLAGKPLLAHVIETALQLAPQAIHVVYGHGGAQLQKTLAQYPIDWVLQTEQLGTGHAVQQAMQHIPHDSTVLILSGDVPLIQSKTLCSLIDILDNKPGLALLLATLENPFGLGRILRDKLGDIETIIEEKDATSAQRQIQEIYSGICCAHSNDLQRWLPKLTNHNQQQEYYLTDIIAMAAAEKLPIQGIACANLYEIQGVNNRLQLQQLERIWQQHQAEQLLLNGVSIADMNRIDIRGNLHCEQDVFIDINCIFIGEVILQSGAQIGPHCVIMNSTIGKNSVIQPHSILENCTIDEDCHIGPFARLRPGTQLAQGCKIGNFVETKNARFGQHTKASHLSYLGDVTIGEGVNIGAGTITCNYDGVNKHHTIIEDGAFIGSDTQLVAPVTVGKNATLGAGCTLRENAPDNALTITLSKQKTIYGWTRPQDRKKE